MFISSAEVTTSSANPVDLLYIPSDRAWRVRIINEGTAGGWFSLDGTVWMRLPPGPNTSVSFNFDGSTISTTLRVKRATTDLSGVYAWAN